MSSDRGKRSVSLATPVEPSKPLDRPSPSSVSPDLEHDGHGSTSPNQLTPIQSLADDKGVIQAPPDLPLFVPAQPDRKTSRASTESGVRPESSPSAQQVALQSSLADSPSKPLEGTPGATLDDIKQEAVEGAEDESRNTIEGLLNEHGLRGARAKVSSTPTAPEPPKKRTAPKSAMPKSAAAKKKGTAKKPAPKKRKTNDGSSAPGSSRKSSSKPAGQESSPLPSDDDTEFPDQAEDEQESDDGGVYCICRKGDNHTWMIACDGPCNDWYHGACVEIDPKYEPMLLSYFCKTCTEGGHGQSQWKEQCRRDGCNQPVLTSGTKGSGGDKVSNYCSKACGVTFWINVLAKANRQCVDQKKSNNTRGNEKDEITNPFGGVISPFQMKALVTELRSSEEFQSLGEKPIPKINGKPIDVSSHKFSAEEQQELDKFAAKTTELRKTLSQLQAREKLCHMASNLSTAYSERESLKPKDRVCGYIELLSFSAGQLDAWLEGPEGKEAMETGKLPLPPPATNGSAGDETASSVSQSSQMCMKKRCERHKGWHKIMLEDVRQTKRVTVDALKRTESDEAEFLEIAKWRKLTEAANAAQKSE